MFQVLDATEEHAVELSKTMKADDVAEVMASHGHNPLRALKSSIRASRDAKALIYDGETIAMFGVANPTTAPLSANGVIWMLTSDKVFDHLKILLPACRRYVEDVMLKYNRVYNFVDERNKKTVRWLKWLGFDIHPPSAYGVHQLPFHYFEMTRK